MMTPTRRPLSVERLDDRLAPAVFAVGGLGGGATVVSGDVVVTNFRPLDAGGTQYLGVAQVAVADFNRDGTPDFWFAASDPAGLSGLDSSKAGLVFVYDGTQFTNGTRTLQPIHVFRPFATTFGPAGTTAGYVNGLNIAAADVDGDGTVDLVAGTRAGVPGAGNREYGRLVVVTPGSAADGGEDGLVVGVIAPFSDRYEKGVVVAAGDTNADGRAEIAVTRGDPVAQTNPNKTVKLKVYRFAGGGSLTELNLSPGVGGGSAVFAPFESVEVNGAVIEQGARVAFVNTNGGGRGIAFTALDTISDPGNAQVRVGVYTINPFTGTASLVSTGTGLAPSTYLLGTRVANYAISGATADGSGSLDLGIVAEVPSPAGLEYFDPLTGTLKSNLNLPVPVGGVTFASL